MISRDESPIDKARFMDRAELEVDLRLLEPMTDALALRGRWTKIQMASFLRLAYVRGYQDALQEAERGQLFRVLGLPVPDRET